MSSPTGKYVCGCTKHPTNEKAQRLSCGCTYRGMHWEHFCDEHAKAEAELHARWGDEHVHRCKAAQAAPVAAPSHDGEVADESS